MTQAKPRFIFITGGVVSSLGKGLSAAALAAVLQKRGFKVRMRKLDPYLNVDPGTMSPYEHGEVYVTEDGGETDLDLGHYERFTGVDTRRSDNVTSGRIYKTIIDRERAGDYLGATVQVVPHVTGAIKEFIQADLSNEDFVLCEIGGIVGDIEGLPFVEAIRELGLDLGDERVCFMHLTLVPYIAAAKELKTKPTQRSVKELQSYGIQPDVLVCRSEHPLDDGMKRKIARFCSVRPSAVIPALDASSIYAVPRALHEQGLDQAILDHFGLDAPQPDLAAWDRIDTLLSSPDDEVRIAVVGKYTQFEDAYKSLVEALSHGGFANDAQVKIDWVDSELLTSPDVTAKRLASAAGILVPGGFGIRGCEGMIEAVRYARENKVPFFGICLGMQMAAIEVTRHLLGIDNAGSTEWGTQVTPVVGFMSEWEAQEGRQTRGSSGDLGGTMRLGAYSCSLLPGSLARQVYGEDDISERHRHRYEINMGYRQDWADKGVLISGESPDGRLPEIMEVEGHPWFIGAQFHPEYKSRPLEPHPLFASFVKASLKQSRLV